MTFKKHNPNLQLAFECALLFLAISVFSWGLQAKLSGYSGEAGTLVSTKTMPKLSTEELSTRAAASVGCQDQPRLTCESLHFAAVAFMLQGNHVLPACLSQSEPWSRVPRRFELYSPDLMHRPPPAFS